MVELSLLFMLVAVSSTMVHACFLRLINIQHLPSPCGKCHFVSRLGSRCTFHFCARPHQKIFLIAHSDLYSATAELLSMIGINA